MIGPCIERLRKCYFNFPDSKEVIKNIINNVNYLKLNDYSYQELLSEHIYHTYIELFCSKGFIILTGFKINWEKLL